MRSPEEVRLVQRLNEEGLNACEIARRTAIPRSTVRGWLAGRVPGARPRRLQSDRFDEASCLACGHPAHDPAGLPAADYSYLLGMYLGDGCLLKHPRVWRLDITLDQRYPLVVGECARSLQAVMPANRVSVNEQGDRGHYVIVRSYSKAWPCLFPQHGPGPKHKRKIALEPWQERIVDAEPERFVRGLIHSDGCRSLSRVNGKVYPRYFFSQVSDDIRGLFCRSLEQLGIRYTRNDHKNVSIARAPCVARLDEFVGPKR
jgi:hypothetical protein